MWNWFCSLKRQRKNQPFRGLKRIKPEECVCRTNDFSPSTTETTVCEPRQIQGQRLQNPDCNRRGCQVRSSGMRPCNLCFKPGPLHLKSSSSNLMPLQRFGYSNSPGCNQPQHPGTPQDLHPQSRTNGKSRWTSHFYTESSSLDHKNRRSSPLLGCSSSAGRNGVSITLVTQYDIHLVHSIEEQIRELDWISRCHTTTTQPVRSLGPTEEFCRFCRD